ncbi:MAG: hypothetical protein OHK0022_60600 [Roseiflexaceae bacterium]
MRIRIIQRSLLVLLLVAAALAGLRPAGVLAASQAVYDDALTAGWQNFSWATVNMAADSPVQAGTKSIAVTFGAWQGLYLGHAGMSTTGYTNVRFFIHGGSAGGQKLQLYAIRSTDSSGQHGPAVAIAAPAANTWREVLVPLSSLGAANSTLTGLVWQDTSGGSQPVLYIDTISLASNESPNGPVVTNQGLKPNAAPNDGATKVVVTAQLSDPQGLSDIASVTLDASAVGRGSVTMRDDGRSNDAAAGDGRFGAVFTIPTTAAAGEYTLLVNATDRAGNSANKPLGAFVVLGRPGGSIPASLPQKLGLGTNQWSDQDTTKDWQVNSRLPWNYAYQYITYEWYSDPTHWSGTLKRFVEHSWKNNYIPVVSVYMMLSVPPATGEGSTQYVQKLQNASTVQTYLAALQLAASEAKGTKPVIFQLEPDFYGYMQQYNYANGRTNPDDPSTIAVALNVSGYPNNLAGFGKRMVDVVRQTAPNVLVAPHASMWATNQDPNNVTAAQASDIGRRVATFMNAMGGSQADLFTVEWSDRDAGSGLRPWWDDTNVNLPRFSRAILWENALSAAAGKRLILWQVPSGNMNLDNTCNRYKDNKAAYVFTHMRELFDAGVSAVLFGGGASCMTQPSTDGGFIQAQSDVVYKLPAAVTGVSAQNSGTTTALVRWNENSEPDIWGYRVTYQLSTGGVATTIDVGRSNATTLLLPSAGIWRITVAAYDALGQTGALSVAANITTSAAAHQVFVPVALR